jgi:hypothetical protein
VCSSDLLETYVLAPKQLTVAAQKPEGGRKGDVERRKSRQREKTTHHNEMGCARRKSYTSAPPIMDAINV